MELIPIVALGMSGLGYTIATIYYLASGSYAMALTMFCYAVSCGALFVVGSK